MILYKYFKDKLKAVGNRRRKGKRGRKNADSMFHRKAFGNNAIRFSWHIPLILLMSGKTIEGGQGRGIEEIPAAALLNTHFPMTQLDAKSVPFHWMARRIDKRIIVSFRLVPFLVMRSFLSLLLRLFNPPDHRSRSIDSHSIVERRKEKNEAEKCD